MIKINEKKYDKLTDKQKQECDMCYDWGFCNCNNCDIYKETERTIDVKKVAQFYKVSYKQFKEGFIDCFGNEKEEVIKEAYENLKHPKRATSGSAGYDFFLPVNVIIEPGTTMKIPTGIRVKIDDGWVLKCYPRSGLGFKFRMQLNNTVGIIDSDYYYSDNEGHIFAKITNDSNENKTIDLDAGAGFMQGIFVEYGITYDDSTTGERNGGFGSTGV